MNLSAKKRFLKVKKSFFGLTFFLMFLNGFSLGEVESPLAIPKIEGSKSFDLEISQINNQGIKKYKQGHFIDAVEQFKKGLALSQQLRDPSQGILLYNLSLSLHKSEKHEDAAKQFSSAKKFARGNAKILKSKLLSMHECRFNSVNSCEQSRNFD